ncbi:MAG: AAA family ATPase, partial [bacterium]|nr:AAA family ATPase [bacterium]
MSMKKLPVGISDFKDMVTGNYCYVDKTLFIKEVIDRGDKILLLPRPRRFGKTLNLSMLKYFYDCLSEEEENKKLFNSLAIWKAGQTYQDKMGKNPIIFLSFRSIKELDWESCISKTKQLVQAEYLRHDYLLNSPELKPVEKDYFKRLINLKGNKGDYENSLEKLLIFLSRHYRKRAVILIDEYD